MSKQHDGAPLDELRVVFPDWTWRHHTILWWSYIGERGNETVRVSVDNGQGVARRMFPSGQKHYGRNACEAMRKVLEEAP
jgi:ABC-type phosphonate transport system ATPase subunit